MRACFPHLCQSDAPRIVNISSCDGANRAPYVAPYSAAKEALRALTGCIAREWGVHGITVNCVCPTASTESLGEYWKSHPELYDDFIAQVPLGRSGDAEADIGRTLVFLVGPDASFITGQTINVDGGFVIHA